MEQILENITNPALIPLVDNFTGEMYTGIFNSMYDGFAFFEFRNNKVRALYVNESYFATVGYTKEEYLPYLDNITVTLFEEDEEALFQKVLECLENKSTLNTEVRGYRGDGSVGWFNIRARQVDYVKSDYPVFVATVMDYTRTKQVEQELALTRERCRIIEETTDTFLFEYKVFEDTMLFYVGMDEPHRVIENYTRFMHTSPMVYKDDISFFYTILMLASRGVVRGHIDYRTTSLQTGYYTWCRAFYSGVTDDRGNVVSVLGRLENLEENDEYSLNAAKRFNPMYDGTDETTGLPRVRTAVKKAEEVLAGATGRFFFILADMDDYSEYVNTHGKEQGDRAVC
ncbi:MAG: PAS domain-containing protein [Oscillospiraceae bacterium]|nr:PAS domain-containing protein [Oscillospiraceae bacterium]